MNPAMEKRNNLLAQTVIRGLKSRNMDGYYAESKEEALRIARLLADMPIEERKLLPGLQPNRADIIVHGICILLSCMDRLGFDRITVSEYGNLDGYLKRRYLKNGGHP